jgi:periplasmic protein TonB
MIPKPPPPKPNKSKLFIGVMLALVLGGGVISFLNTGGKSPKRSVAKSDTITVTLPPPPPPPPPPKVEPPPPQDEPKKEEMVEQDPVPENEPPPVEAPVDEPPSETLGTNNTGNGPNMGLSRNGGNGGGNRNSIGGQKGSKFGSYAAKVQRSIKDALDRNSSTNKSTFSIQVRIWADSNGLVTRAQLVGSTGNSSVDQAIKNQVLAGLQLPEPPPSDMPMPINLRISARKP